MSVVKDKNKVLVHLNVHLMRLDTTRVLVHLIGTDFPVPELLCQRSVLDQ